MENKTKLNKDIKKSPVPKFVSNDAKSFEIKYQFGSTTKTQKFFVGDGVTGNIEYVEYNDALHRDVDSKYTNERYYDNNGNPIYNAEATTVITLKATADKIVPVTVEYILDNGARKTDWYGNDENDKDKIVVKQFIYGNWFETVDAANNTIFLNAADQLKSRNQTSKHILSFLEPSLVTRSEAKDKDGNSIFLKYQTDVYAYPSSTTKKRIHKAGDDVLEEVEKKDDEGNVILDKDGNIITEFAKIPVYKYTTNVTIYDRLGKTVLPNDDSQEKINGYVIYPYFNDKNGNPVYDLNCDFTEQKGTPVGFMVVFEQDDIANVDNFRYEVEGKSKAIDSLLEKNSLRFDNIVSENSKNVLDPFYIPFLNESNIRLNIIRSTSDGSSAQIYSGKFYPACQIAPDVLKLNKKTEVEILKNFFKKFEVVETKALGTRLKAFDNITTDINFPSAKSVDPYGMYESFKDSRMLTGFSFGDEIADKVTIGDYGMFRAFSGCWSSNHIDISRVSDVGNYGMYQAFMDNRCVKAVDFSSITTIGNYGMFQAFKNCIDLTGGQEVIFSSLRKVADYGMERCFEGCKLFGKPYSIMKRYPVEMGEDGNDYVKFDNNTLIPVEGTGTERYAVLGGHKFYVYTKGEKQYVDHIIPRNIVVVEFPALQANVIEKKTVISGVNIVETITYDNKGNPKYAADGHNIGVGAFHNMFKGCYNQFEIHFPYTLEEEFGSLWTPAYLGCKNAEVFFDLDPADGEIPNNTYRLKCGIGKVFVYDKVQNKNVYLDLTNNLYTVEIYYGDDPTTTSRVPKNTLTNIQLDKPLIIEGIKANYTEEDSDGNIVTVTQFPVELDITIELDGKTYSGTYVIKEFDPTTGWYSYMIIEDIKVELVDTSA